MNKRFTMVLIYIITIFSAVNFAQVPVITNEPVNRGVIEGQTAAFFIQAQGASLTYQWFKNDTLIVGATDSAYTTPATVLSDNKSKFNCVVTNISGSDTSNNATLYVTATGSRVTEGIQVLYNFNEAGGNIVKDNSGIGSPYDLDIMNTSAVTWTTKGMGVNDLAFINGTPPLTKAIDACKLTNEITIELWVQPSSVNYSDWAKILTLSDDNYTNNNFTIMQSPTGEFVFRVRTTSTNNFGVPSLNTAAGTASKQLIHLVFTKSSNGERKIYKNGVEIASDILGGDFSNWDSADRLQLAYILGNGGLSWLGTYYLVSVYERALNSPEVVGNYNVGVDADRNPVIITEPEDQGLLVGQSGQLSVKYAGDTPSFQWKKNGVDIVGATNSFYDLTSVPLSNNGALYSCIVSNGFGSDTSRNATLYVTDLNSRVTSELITLYTFQEGIGDTIKDVSPNGLPVNLKINSPDAVEWKPYGLVVNSPSNIASIGDAAKINYEVVDRLEFSFEAWVKPENVTQSGTLVTISRSSDPAQLNFKLKTSDLITSWLRTSTSPANGIELKSPDNSVSDSMIHIVYTHSPKELSKIYVNGLEVSSDYITGDLSEWRPDYYLKIANQFLVSQPWTGLYNLLSFYGRALNPVEIQQNFSLGPVGKIIVKTPGQLSAQANIPGQVNLSWTDSSDAEDGFIIERKQSGFSYAVIDTAATNDTSYTDVNVADTTNYTYRIKGFNLLTQSAYSNEASVTTILSTIAAPTNLTASLSPTIVNRVLLNWQDNSSNESGFIVERKTGDSASVNPFTVLDSLGANVTSYVDSSALADTTTYTFRVKAFDAFLVSGYSNMAPVTTILSTVAAPSNLTAITVPPDTQNVHLAWVDNSSNELGFIIERKTGDSSSVAPFAVIDSVAANVISYTDTTVADTTTYTYKVRGFNVFALSNYSNLAEVKTPVPVELTSFIASVIYGRVQLDWETATELNNAGFTIQRSKDNNKFLDLAFLKGKGTTTTPSSYSYSDKSVLSGKYYYRLKQVDFDGSANYLKSIEVDLGIPKDYALEQNYPNPFNPSTTIRFALPINAKVTIILYNTLGQEVAKILNTDLDAGIHETIFNASNLSSGVYFYMLKVQGTNGSNFTSTKRMVLLK